MAHPQPHPPTGLRLPAPLDTATVYAAMRRHCRLVHWTVHEPGELFRNSYEMAFIEISEEQPWTATDLTVSAARRIGQSMSRKAFTDAGRQQLHDQIVPIVAGYGFDKLWTLTHSSTHTPKEQAALESAERSRREAEWWDARAVLAGLHDRGHLRFSALDLDTPDPHRETVASSDPWSQYQRATVVAAAVHHGRHVGWLTEDAKLVPDGALLKPSA